ncbi:serine O-acetyltransferase [Sulfurospirillum multivorans]|uniref:serine O-acetyltransferase n=2 Tax=Sulfurospirillum multivorans TaxID=66821 RepID=A0AA86ANY8_SULMK|nr:serine O-acetyltransferase [Sulfurospirillum multivorans]AHJ12913.1 serine acetyltransferase [Sulfurospirillum multivorans DSM 12446]QEH06404.1 serine acetyltransferase [Sulfurospirillum multivorans]
MNSVSLWEKIKEDFSQPILHDPAINSKVELFFNYPGVWALANYRIAHALHVKGFKTLARALMGISQIITNTDIHPACTIGRRVFIDHAFGVVIGETAIVGDDVLIYQGVTLGGVSLERGVKRHPTIGNHTVIGSGAKILGDITIGENCRIGSNSVVVKSIPDDSTAVGLPARIIDKGRDKNPMAHNKIPDINKELFIYMFKRIKILEEAVLTTNKDLKIKDDELEAIYKCYLESVKE